MLVAAAIVFFLAYRDVRLSTNAGVALGIFEIGVFLALAIWMILSNLAISRSRRSTRRTPRPGTFNGMFKGMVFTILAFIGFEAAAPLGEEARPTRAGRCRARSSARASLIGIFYVVCSYAWVVGTGFDNFTEDTLAEANPWRHLADDLLGRRLGADLLRDHQLGDRELERRRERGEPRHLRDGAQRRAPAAFARTHPVHKTPHVAIIAQTVARRSCSRC